MRQIFRKKSISYPLYLCVSGSKKCSFFGKFGVLYFLETSVLRFALLPYYRRLKPQDENWTYTRIKIFRRCIEHFLSVLSTRNLCPLSRGEGKGGVLAQLNLKNLSQIEGIASDQKCLSEVIIRSYS